MILNPIRDFKACDLYIALYFAANSLNFCTKLETIHVQRSIQIHNMPMISVPYSAQRYYSQLVNFSEFLFISSFPHFHIFLKIIFFYLQNVRYSIPFKNF